MRRRNLPRTFDELAGLRARGLVRESTVEQGGHSGPIVQEREQRAFAERWSLLGPDRLYTDFRTGSDALKRPEFLRMVKDAQAGEFDVLLVYDTSRFMRNWEQAGRFQGDLHDAGVVVAYIQEGILSTGSNVVQGVFHGVNADWLRVHAGKVQQGYRVRRFEAGKFSGSPPLGYVMEYADVDVGGAKGHERRDTGRLLPDTTPRARIGKGTTYTDAEMVRTIGELYASGRFGARALAAHLNLEGYRTRRGEPFTGNGLRHMLASPTYAGLLSWHHRKDKRDRGETGELVKGDWEPIWPEALWRQIVAVRGRLFRGSTGGRLRLTYPFRRLAVCDRCDRKLIGEAHKDVPYMVCSTQRERHECDQKAVRSVVLEDQVERWLATLVIPDDWKEDIERLQRREARREEGPTIDKSAIEGQRRRLVDAYIGMHIGREEFVGRMRALEATLRGGLPQPTYSEVVLAEAKRALGNLSALWHDATPAERAELMGATFREVRVRDKEIVYATPAEPEYAAVLATSEAARLRVVGVAPPDGLEPPTRTLGRCRSIH